MDVIKLADYIIDIGPEGGKGGGQLVAKGTPEEIIKNKKSYTAQFLKKELV
jgi:excinuclease ABC subunit A